MTSLLRRLPPAEWALYGAFAALAVIACAGPHLTQHAHYHAFADQRTVWGLPHALDVLSNLAFALAGVLGLSALARWLRTAAVAERATTAGLGGLFFGGLLLTAVGSSLYHWQPQDATLLWDRAGMLVAFAGVTGLAVAGRIGARPAGVATALMLAAGAWALQRWETTGQLLPWAVLQGGGMALMLALAWLPQRREAPALSLAAVIGWYALAKVLEWGDHAVWEATQHLVSGHSLKHAVAALAAWPVIAALRGDRAGGQATGSYFAQCVRRTAWRRPAAAAPQAGAAAHAAAHGAGPSADRSAGTMAADATGGASALSAARRPSTPSHRSMA